MDRPIIDAMEQMRDFDFVMGFHDVLVALSGLSADVFSAPPSGLVGGLVATQTAVPSLTINIGSGRLYQYAASDATAVGSIPQDSNIILQQGYAASQTVTLVPPAAGQSQWSLIQAAFAQGDAVRGGDPNGGIVPFYNAANPSQPISTSINTVRQGVCVIQVISGAPATTGSETPPQPTNGWVGLYLIDLAGGQGTITTNQILKAGPSVGTGVPTNYPYAPFIGGLGASHHFGTIGQAPKVHLDSEVQGILPYSNMATVRTFLTGNLTLYVNGATGSDTNVGTSPSAAFKTLTACRNAIYHSYDFAGFGVTVVVANGTYTDTFTCVGVPPGMPGAIAVVGNTSSPSLCTVSVTNGDCFVATGGASLNVSGFTVAATGSAGAFNAPGVGLLASNGVISFSAMTFGACSTSHLWAGAGGTVSAGGNAYTISGGGVAHATATVGGQIVTVSSRVTMSGAPAFSTGYAYASQGGCCTVYNQTFVGSTTGPRFNVSTGGMVITNNGGANYLPGSTAGVGTNFGVSPWGLYA